MKITENMLCPHCITKSELKPVVKYRIFKNTYHMLTKALERTTNTDWYIAIGDEDPRVWRLKENPVVKSEVEAEYLGRKPRGDVRKSGELAPGEMWNPSRLSKSLVKVTNMGIAEADYARDGRLEVITLHPLTGNLQGTITIKQCTPAKNEYTTIRKLIQQFSLHQHIWDKGTHYDIRIDRGDFADEWATIEDPRAITKATETLRKICSDKTWMTFQGERTISGIPTQATLIDRGTAEIIEDSRNFFKVKFTGADTDITLMYKFSDGKWTVEELR